MNDEPKTLDNAVVDELRASVGGDESFVRELAAAYLAEGPTHLEAMAAALAKTDIEGLVRPAHTLKSSSAALGAMRLSQICRGIEHAAREGRAEGLAEAVDDARATWTMTEAAMRAEGLAD